MKKIFLAVLLLFCISQPAKAVSFTWVGGAGLSGALATGASYTTAYHTLQYGGGLLLGFRMVPGLTMELGMLYLPRGFNQTLTGSSVSTPVTFSTIQTPLLLRFFVLPTISFGLGAYFSHGIGYVTDLTGLVPYGGNNGTNSYGADDYGFVGSLGLHLPMTRSVSFVVEGRYLGSLVNINKNSGASTTLTDLQGLAGIKIGR